jgi:hypothetical protein
MMESKATKVLSSKIEYIDTTAVPAKEVSFEISNADDMPVVMDNHFES